MEATLDQAGICNDLGLPTSFNGAMAGVQKALADGKKFALARMADGERALANDQAIRGADGWTSPGTARLRDELLSSLRCDLPGYHLGVSCPCCDLGSHQYYKEYAKAPLTYSNLFANANYQFFRAWMTSLGHPKISVGCYSGCDVVVPQNVVNEEWDMTEAVDQMKKLRSTIWVAAGPASCVLIRKYWATVEPEDRQTIIDVGGAMDFMYTGRIARGYQDTANPASRKVCHWS